MHEQSEPYQNAIRFLFDRTNFERTPSGASRDFKLGRIRRLLSYLGDPQNTLPCIHIAGTKGKGSTAIMLAEMLLASGYRVGIYTSPHVESFEERMHVNGCGPTRDQLVALVERLRQAVGKCESDPQPFVPTFFEATTALAWLYFESQRAEIVVLEVGLGGRLDSTNVCSPVVCVLTTISRDHTQLLGSTLSGIAHEKAGIVKLGVPVISGVQCEQARPVIEETCNLNQAELWQLGRDFVYEFSPGHRQDPDPDPANSDIEPHRVDYGTVDITTPFRRWPTIPLTLSGEHQAHNAAVAVATIEKLREVGWGVSLTAAMQGLSRVRWPLRIEIIRQSPLVILDAAHNWESIAALGKTLDAEILQSTIGRRSSRRVLIFAATSDKDILGIARQLLPRFDCVVLTQYLNNPRAVPVDVLLRTIESVSDVPCHVAKTPAEAWGIAHRCTTEIDLICVTGSFYIAAEIRDLVPRFVGG